MTRRLADDAALREHLSTRLGQTFPPNHKEATRTFRLAALRQELDALEARLLEHRLT